VSDQKYEKYWEITLAYTDIFGEGFNTSLRIIIDFIDERLGTPYSKEKYEELQNRLQKNLPKSLPSIRKSINQFVKLGFVRPGLAAYHPAAKIFLKETDAEKKRAIFSRIVYAYSSFDSSVKDISDKKEINFLIKTLQAVGRLERADVLALMTVDVSQVPQGYLDAEGLSRQRQHAQAIGFGERKYNQLSHFWSVLGNLDGIVVRDGSVLEKTVMVADEPASRAITKRDSYLQLLYKIELQEESSRHFGTIACMVEKLPYPSLIASHIKPYRECNIEIEAFDGDNGLLLSPNLDSLFDKGYISFASDGSILLSNNLQEKLKAALKHLSLDRKFLTEGRLVYLEHHRTKVFV